MYKPNKVILICGYRRTGKDTFFTTLSCTTDIVDLEVSFMALEDSNEDTIGNDDLFFWRFYKHPNAHHCTICPNLNCQRIAFADSLKEEAAARYGIPISIPDTEKDVKQFVHYRTGDIVSARDIYIEWGRIRRSEDPDYWCKEAFKRGKSNNSKSCSVVTDWRYHNEATYTMNNYDDVLTIRLYRSDVPEPDVSIESEHNLDTYRTDFLLLRADVDGEYEKAVKKFPQYEGYVPCVGLY